MRWLWASTLPSVLWRYHHGETVWNLSSLSHQSPPAWARPPDRGSWGPVFSPSSSSSLQLWFVFLLQLLHSTTIKCMQRQQEAREANQRQMDPRRLQHGVSSLNTLTTTTISSSLSSPSMGMGFSQSSVLPTSSVSSLPPNLLARASSLASSNSSTPHLSLSTPANAGSTLNSDEMTSAVYSTVLREISSILSADPSRLVGSSLSSYTSKPAASSSPISFHPPIHLFT